MTEIFIVQFFLPYNNNNNTNIKRLLVFYQIMVLIESIILNVDCVTLSAIEHLISQQMIKAHDYVLYIFLWKMQYT